MPWFFYGEGPAETGKGIIPDGQNVKYTAEDIRFTLKIMFYTQYV